MQSLQLLRPESPPLITFRHYSTPSLSVDATDASLSPTRLLPACYHHCIPTCAPGALSNSSHRSNSDCVVIYCATVFWRRQMYSSIVKNPASSLAIVAKFYVHFLPGVLGGIRSVNCITT